MLSMILVAIVFLFLLGFVFFTMEWKDDFYDMTTNYYAPRTSLWSIIMTKKLPCSYSLKKLRKEVEKLHLLDEIEEDTEFFDDYGYELVVNKVYFFVFKSSGNIASAILHATWHALDENEKPTADNEVSTVEINLSKAVAQQLFQKVVS